MRQACLRGWVWLTSLIATLPASAADPAGPLTNLTEVLQLPRSESKTGRPVKVRGVVTWLRAKYGFFVAAGDAAIYARFRSDKNQMPRLEPGAMVEVEGITEPGGYAPTIRAAKVTVLGQTELPAPREVTLNLFTSGNLDCRLVRVRGVAQSVWHNPEDNAVNLQISMDGSPGVVEFPGDVPVSIPELEQLIDASIQVDGALSVVKNSRGEMIGFHILALGRQSITEIHPPPPDPFLSPPTPLNQLNTFKVRSGTPHRIVTAGTVTYQQPGRYVVIQDDGVGVRIGTRTQETFSPGDQVKATGFRDLTRPVTGLTEALLQRTGTGPAPNPQSTQVSTILADQNAKLRLDIVPNDWDHRLVTVTGVLKEVRTTSDGSIRLLLDQDRTLFEATLPVTADPKSVINHWTRDSVLEITGVCELEFSGLMPAVEPAKTTKVNLLCRTLADIKVVQAASWWTRDRLMLTVGLVLLLLLLILIWNLTLRHRVATKSAALALALRDQHNVNLEFQAERRERRRLAGDLHDLISQGISAAAMQLDAARLHEARDPDKAAAHRTTAREQLARCSEDVRRTLWGLRADVLDGRTFTQALTSLTMRQTKGTTLKCRVESDPELDTSLPEFISGNLLILVQEALSNTLRHASASDVSITCRPENRGVLLVIEDNGIGFNPTEIPHAGEDHIGLRTMRERIELLHGTLTVESTPGTGTRLSVHLPAEAISAAEASYGE